MNWTPLSYSEAAQRYESQEPDDTPDTCKLCGEPLDEEEPGPVCTVCQTGEGD